MKNEILDEFETTEDNSSKNKYLWILGVLRAIYVPFSVVLIMPFMFFFTSFSIYSVIALIVIICFFYYQGKKTFDELKNQAPRYFKIPQTIAIIFACIYLVSMFEDLSHYIGSADTVGFIIGQSSYLIVILVLIIEDILNLFRK